MRPSTGPLVPLALAIALASSAGAAPEPAPKPSDSVRTRRELDALQRSLEGAVDQVARAAGAWGPQGSRAYRLEGTGVVVLLAPRLLPVPRRANRSDSRLARAIDEAIRGLEESQLRAETPDVRDEIRRSLQQLRLTRSRLDVDDRARPGFSLTVPPEVEAELMDMQAQAEQFRRQAAAAQQEAERELAAHLQAMGVTRVTVPPTAPEVMALPAGPPTEAVAPLPPAPASPPKSPPAPLSAPAPPGGLVPRADEAREPRMLPLSPEAPLPPAPWDFWFATSGGEPDRRTPDELVSAVREAVAAALLAHRGPAPRLAPEETISVAIDFLPRRAMDAPRTLVVRVKASDLGARGRGKIDEGEFRRRVFFAEY